MSTYIKTPKVKIVAPKLGPGESAKIKKNDDPSPVSYDVEKSYKTSQIITSKFVISKSKFLKFADKMAKEKSFVPGAGTYNPEKSFELSTRGLAKGWK